MHRRMSWMTLGLAVAACALALPAGAAPTRTTVVLTAPGAVRASAWSSDFVQVSWTDTNTKETGYAVERATTASGPFTEIATTRRNVEAIGDVVTANSTYFYRVRAKGRRNVFSPYSAVVSATTPKAGDRWPPTVPTDVTVQATACDQVVIQWTASRDGGGMKGYNVRRGTTTQFVAGTFLTDTVPAGTLSYTVTAIDISDNESAPSSPVVITPPPCPGPGSWAKRFGGAADEIVQDTALDASGNVYVVGRFTGDTNLGGATLSSAGMHDAFVAKYTSDGTHVWSKRFGATMTDSANAVTVDRVGNVVVVGTFQGTVNFGGAALTSASAANDIFVVKLSSAGGHVSSVRYGGPGDDYAYAVAVDRDNNLVLGGTYYNGASLGGPVLNALNTDSFVAKYSATGQYLWAKQLRSNYSNAVYGVATDAAGNIAATGFFNGAADFGNGPVPSNNYSPDVFVAMLSPSGQWRWERHFGQSGDDFGHGVAIDSVGDVVVSGRISGIVDFGAGPMTPTGYTFLAKYSNTGALRWSRTIGNFGDVEQAPGIAVGPDNSIVIAGTTFAATQWPAKFGGMPLTGAAVTFSGGVDAFVAKYTPAGAHVWSNLFGGPIGVSNDSANGVAIDAMGRAFVAGNFSTTLRFPGETLTTAGRVDGFLMRLAL